MSQRLYRASRLSPVRLGASLGKGGEGEVFLVHASPHLVAKLYRKPPGPLKAQKLLAMMRMASPALLRVAAWPIDVLLDASGTVRGFLMEKVSARQDVHELYSPKSRKRAFPRADFGFVVRAAANLARTFVQLHEQGHVIGDVNHGNALVGRDATVVLIDCDSFQIRDRVRTYTCDVGVPLFTAPELQAKGFRGLRRSTDHDAFGLAVLLFHLLFAGRHPFAGRHSSGEMPIERAIAESRFVYGSAAASLGMSAPPGTLPLTAFGPQIAALFERAFMPGTADRPAATEWVAALQQLEQELVPCPLSSTHFSYRAPGRASSCCWCEVEGATGVQLFGGEPRGVASVAAVDLVTLWSAIAAVPRPPQLLATPTPGKTKVMPQSPRRHAINAYSVSIALLLVGGSAMLVNPGVENHFFLAFVSFAGAITLSSWHGLRRRTRFPGAWLRIAESRWEHVIEQWNRECSTEPFDEVLQHLRETREKLAALPGLRQTQVVLLDRQKLERQRERHLRGFRLADATFSAVSPKLISKLVQFGIETAADVARERARLSDVVSGKVLLELLTWYRACSRQFLADPNESHSPDDIRHVEEMLRTRQQQLLEHLRKGPALLQRKHQDLARTRAAFQPRVDQAWDALVHARRRAQGETQ